MSVIGSNILAGASGGAGAAEFKIERSLRFNSADSAYLDRTPSSGGNRRTWTWSGWVKRAAAGAYDFLFMAQTSSSLKSSLSFWNGDYIRFKGDYNDGTARNFSVSTNALFRDPSAWYHVVCRLDTTQATEADRIKIWVNGVEQTFSSATYPTQNSSIEFNNTSPHLLGSQTGAAQNGLDGYLAEVHFVDQALAATDFGEYDDNNVWQLKEVNITGPNNGTTWSDGGDDSDLAAGSWANVFNGASSDDHGTFSTVASEQGSGNSATITFSPAISGVIDVVMSAAASSGSYDGGVALSDGTTIGVSSHSGSPKLQSFGSKTNITSLTLNAGSNGGCSISEIRLDGVPLIDGDTTNIGVNGFRLDFSDNSSSTALGYDAAGSNNWTVNNLTATQGTAYQGFNVITYTGNGTAGYSIGGLGFQPDFVWIKSRDNARPHMLFDSVRGIYKRLYSHDTAAEDSDSSTLTAFNSNGFTVSTNSAVNVNNENYVAWCWKAGGTASSNTDGSITSSVSASTTYGFSIVNYTGTGANATVGHGLGSAADFIIIKNRDTALGDAWRVWHSSLANNERLVLSGNNSVGSATTLWQNTAPTSSVFYLDNDTRYNTNGDNHIAYCWSEVSGFSKFGSYSGSGASGKTLTGFGFKPRWILIKNTSAAQNWFVYDTQRGPDSANNDVLRPNTDAAELQSSVTIDFDADGITINSSDAAVNASGNTYIYAAYAESPGAGDIDSLLDTPTDYEADTGNNGGNYATILATPPHTPVLANGNLDVSETQGNEWRFGHSSIGFSSGKFYAEYTVNSGPSGHQVGIVNLDDIVYASNFPVVDFPYGFGYISVGRIRSDYGGSNQTNSVYGSGFGAGDTIGIAFDADTGALTFYVNGTSQGATSWTAAPSAGTWAFGASLIDAGASGTWNFGQRPFAYTPPTDYKSLCTTNLLDPTIADGSTAFDVATWTGANTNAANTISGLNFSPDLVWSKSRSNTYNHQLIDSVRSGNKSLASNLTDAEVTDEQYGYIDTFNSDGFTTTPGTGDNDYFNGTGKTYVAWTWDAGDSNTSISAGGLNSSFYNQSQTWSTYGTFDDRYGGGFEWDDVFNDGNGANANDALYINNNTLGDKWTLTQSVAVTSSVKVYAQNTVEVVVNAGLSDETSVSGGASNQFKYVEVPFSGNVASVTIKSAGAYVVGIWFDGLRLIDDTETPTNVPSIASTVRANPTAGFSIVSYTGNSTQGATIGHGLNSTPALIIAKNLDFARDWPVFVEDLGVNSVLRLNSTAATIAWTDTYPGLPTSSVFTVGNWNGINSSSYDYIAYCFAPVEGYSAFGSYTGNGSAAGPFVYTGFRPRFLLLKNSSATGVWSIFDTERDTFNVMDARIEANDSAAEGNSSANPNIVDALSNGFKVRYSGQNFNGNGNTIIYAAFAEHPFKTARAR